jgi:hypothetical protein
MKLIVAILAGTITALASNPIPAGAAESKQGRVAEASTVFDEVSSNGRQMRRTRVHRRKAYVHIHPRACNSVVFYRSPACPPGIVTFGPYGPY